MVDFVIKTSRPAFALKIGERDITPTLGNCLISLTLTDNRGFEADTLELVLGDEAGTTPLPPRGTRISAALGWEGEALVNKGEFVVDEVEHSGPPDRISLRARSADLRTGITNKRERSFSGKTLGEIAHAIGEPYGLEVLVSEKIAHEVIDHIDQTSESDANLITRLAREFDALAAVKHGKLIVMPIGEAESVTGIPFPTAIIKRESGDGHRFAIAERDAYTAVKAYYQDIQGGTQGEIEFDGREVKSRLERSEVRKRKERAEYSSVVTYFAPKKQTRSYGKIVTTAEGQRVSTERGNIHTLEKPASGNGVRVLTTVYAKRATAEDAGRKAWATISKKKEDKEAALQEEIDASAPIDEASVGSQKTLRHTYASKLNAERAVRAEWQRLQRGLASFSISLARGRADLFPELPAMVDGFKAEIDAASWIITRVTHRLDESSGYLTDLELELAVSD